MTAEKGKQTWRTPTEFLEAVRKRFGSIDFDLAATPGHQVTGERSDAFFSPEQDSLQQDWSVLLTPAEEHRVARVAFLNPPFATLAPWAKKVAACRSLARWTIMLVPASMGSRWWADHVLGQTMVFGVPRIKFVGAESLYPKDLALVCAGFGVSGTGYWDWRKEIAEEAI